MSALGLISACASSAPQHHASRRPQAKPKAKGARTSGCEALWNKIWEAELKLQEGQRESKTKLRSRAKWASGCPDDGTVAHAMALALVWGRAAQGRGLVGLNAFRQAAQWGELAVQRDAEFKDGMPRRVLGTMWALGGQHLKHADSEEGLELLFDQVKRYPQEPENALRLIQALVSLGDLEGGHEIRCAIAARPGAWTALRSEGKALLGELEAGFTAEGLRCEAAPTK